MVSVCKCAYFPAFFLLIFTLIFPLNASSAEQPKEVVRAYNKAIDYEESGDLENAWKHYDLYLCLDPEAEDADEVKGWLREIEKKLSCKPDPLECENRKNEETVAANEKEGDENEKAEKETAGKEKNIQKLLDKRSKTVKEDGFNEDIPESRHDKSFFLDRTLDYNPRICAHVKRAFMMESEQIDVAIHSCRDAIEVALWTCKSYGCRDISFTGECTSCTNSMDYLTKNCIQNEFRSYCKQGFSMQRLYEQRHEYSCEESSKVGKQICGVLGRCKEMSKDGTCVDCERAVSAEDQSLLKGVVEHSCSSAAYSAGEYEDVAVNDCYSAQDQALVLCKSLGCLGVSPLGSCYSCPTYYYKSRMKQLIENSVRDLCADNRGAMPTVSEAREKMCGESMEDLAEKCRELGCGGSSSFTCVECPDKTDAEQKEKIENEVRKICDIN